MTKIKHPRLLPLTLIGIVLTILLSYILPSSYDLIILIAWGAIVGMFSTYMMSNINTFIERLKNPITREVANSIQFATAITLLSISIGWAFSRSNFQHDFTKHHTHSLSAESKNSLISITEDTTIALLPPFNKTTKHLVELFARNSKKLHTQIINLSTPSTKTRTLLSRLNLKASDLHGSIALYSKSKVRVLTKQTIKSLDTQSAISNLIASLNDTPKDVAYSSKSRLPLSAIKHLTPLLAQHNIKIISCDISKGIPEKAPFVFIAGVKENLTDTEKDEVQKYLAGGGSLLLTLDPEWESNFNTILTPLGITISNTLYAEKNDVAKNWFSTQWRVGTDYLPIPIFGTRTFEVADKLLTPVLNSENGKTIIAEAKLKSGGSVVALGDTDWVHPTSWKYSGVRNLWSALLSHLAKKQHVKTPPPQPRFYAIALLPSTLRTWFFTLTLFLPACIIAFGIIRTRK